MPRETAQYFPGMEPTPEEAAAVDAALAEVPAFRLPTKPTCAPIEAAQALGVSERLIRYAIEDGTLAAVAANRSEAPIKHRWRVVVRLDRDDNTRRQFGLTLEEWYKHRRNVKEEECYV